MRSVVEHFVICNFVIVINSNCEKFSTGSY